MCGICGIWFKGNGRLPTVELVREMSDTLQHRGPDEEGIQIVSDVGLGHRRLSIIDPAGGQQPMSNEDGTVWVVFNGEIYNFRELRAELQGRGHRFRTNCDTEVLVHLYEERGERMCEQLRGMFAFGIWDDSKRQLFLCRDRLGVKPLYYLDGATGMAFASELKTLLPLFGSPPELVPEAISDYFTFGYVPSPSSPFKGIHKLAPAHWARVTSQGVHLERYWSPLPAGEPEKAAPAEALAQLVDEAVRIRLVSDVDFGAFLSGGVDSSTVCALMQRHMKKSLKTFSIGFEEQAFNETPHSSKVADHLGTSHLVQFVKPDALKLLPKLAWHFDEPFADSSAIPTWYLSELAREHVFMVHSGDGGDELFGGYRRYYNELAVQRLTSALGPNGVQAATRLLRALPFGGKLAARLLRILTRSRRDPVERYKAGVGLFVNGFEEVLPESLRYRSTGVFEKAFQQSGFKGGEVTLKTLGLVDLVTYLPEDVLTKVDRMSMAHSLETRVPLLDHKLVEFAFSLDDQHKRGAGGGKRILKELAASLVPPQVVYRPKSGFAVPLASWFRNELKEMMGDLHSMANHPSFDFIQRGVVQRMVSEHACGKFDHAERLWSVLMFQNWVDSYVSRPRPAYRQLGAGL